MSADPAPPRRPPAARPGIKAVAIRAGVGVGTASRAMSDQPNVSKEMRARVLRAAEELGYRPNLVARSLRSHVSHSVGFVVTDITNPLISAFVLGAEDVLSAAGYTVILTNSAGDPALDAARIATLRQRQVDGFLLLPALEDDADTLAVLRELSVPIVVIDRTLPDDLEASYVLSDHQSGIEQAARHLLQKGHRRLGIVVGREVRPTRDRLTGMERGCRRRGRPLPFLVHRGPLSAEHGALALRDLLAEPEPPTAIILGGNQLLEGALTYVRRHGIELERDLSLICCDDIPLSTLNLPPLATVKRDNVLMGRTAARLLLDRLQEQPPQTVLLPTWFEPARPLA